MKKILVVRYRFIGDTILSIPFLRNLRYNYPDAQIDMLVSPNSGEVVEECPYVNNFIYFDTTRKHKYENGEGKRKSLFYYIKLLRKEKYDKAYILKRSFSSAFLCFMAGIKERIGFDTENRGFLLTKKVKYNLDSHESQCFLDVLRADSLNVKDDYLENWINPESETKVKNLFEKYNIGNNIKKAVVNITATNDWKVWDRKNYIQIIEYLSEIKGVQVIFIGAECDKEKYDTLKYSKKLKLEPVNLCGLVSIKDSLAVIKNVDIMIGNDSGTLHMASSVNTRVIGLYGPMPFNKWYALGENNILLKADLDCIPCSLKRKCHNNKACMKEIKTDDVKKAIDSVFCEMETEQLYGCEKQA